METLHSAGMIKSCALFLFAMLLFAHPSPALAVDARIVGVVRVIDGDTLDVAGTRIRLFGIDAVEGDQPCADTSGAVFRCGEWVTAQVRTAFEGKSTSCLRVDTDRYGRTVARCAIAGNDIGLMLVAKGLAFSYARYSKDYVAVEAQAKRAGRGIHAYSTLRPDAFRKAKKAAARKTTRLN